MAEEKGHTGRSTLSESPYMDEHMHLITSTRFFGTRTIERMHYYKNLSSEHLFSICGSFTKMVWIEIIEIIFLNCHFRDARKSFAFQFYSNIFSGSSFYYVC